MTLYMVILRKRVQSNLAVIHQSRAFEVRTGGVSMQLHKDHSTDNGCMEVTIYISRVVIEKVELDRGWMTFRHVSTITSLSTIVNTRHTFIHPTPQVSDMIR
jgi:hypothetical protein